MAVQMSELLAIQRGSLRYEPTRKRVRARLGDATVVDSDRAVLVWEPRRVVPGYAVPAEHITADIVDPAPGGADDEHDHGTEAPDTADYDRIPYWDPRTPFAVRKTPGRTVLLRAQDLRPVEAFLPDDPDLAGMVILDFPSFDTWLEDDDVVVSHPHDPFARIDIRRSGKRITISLDGEIVADSTSVRLLYETGLPERYYLPLEDVRVELQPSATRTVCSYKGTATYFSPVVHGVPVPDFAWSYPEPLVDALGVRDRICFFHERMDLSIDGIEQPRPWTPWS